MSDETMRDAFENLEINHPELIAKRRERVERERRYSNKARERARRRAYLNECKAPRLTAKLGSFWPKG